MVALLRYDVFNFKRAQAFKPAAVFSLPKLPIHSLLMSSQLILVDWLMLSHLLLHSIPLVLLELLMAKFRSQLHLFVEVGGLA